MNKRAQVAIFFVIGLIIIMVGSVYFYYQRITIKETDVIQPEVAPIQSFVVACIDQTATDAITILGLNGGYIDFPLRIETNPNSYLRGPIDNVKNPYWWYDGIKAVPTEEFMIGQLEDNINEELRTCLNNFEDFDEFEVKELGDIVSEVILTENDVVVNVNFPIDVFKKENRTRVRFEKFSKTVPIRLKQSYEFAKKIMEAENRDHFLERKTIDLISLDEDIPTTDIESTCDDRIWIFKDVENKLKRLLRVNLPYIRVKGSDYLENIYVPNPFGEDTYQDSYYQNHYIWEVSDETYPEFKTAFLFNENWPFEIQARPRDGNLLKSNVQKGFGLLDFFCLHIWHFSYDAIFPVKITVSDSNPAFRPYSFSFAFEVSVDHNQPNRKNLGTTIFETAGRPSTEEFCSDVTNEIAIYTVSNTTDGQIDITGVNLTLTCGSYTCKLGQSEWLSFGAAAGTIKETPYCVSAILRGKKEGFLDGQRFIQTDTERTYTLHMKPVKEYINYKVVKHSLEDISTENPLKPDERASIQLKSTDSSFETFGVYPVVGEFPLKLFDDEATYEVIVYLTDDENLIGGYTRNWTVYPDDLSKTNEIVFHVVEPGKLSDEKRALFIADLDGYSKQIPKPELK